MALNCVPVSLSRTNGGAGDGFIDRSKGFLSGKDNVTGIFRLHYAQVMARLEDLRRRAVALCVLIQPLLQFPHVKSIGDLRRLGPVVARFQNVICPAGPDAPFCHLTHQPVVTIEIELQPEEAIRRHPQITRPQFLINKIKIVMQAQSAGGL